MTQFSAPDFYLIRSSPLVESDSFSPSFLQFNCPSVVSFLHSPLSPLSPLVVPFLLIPRRGLKKKSFPTREMQLRQSVLRSFPSPAKYSLNAQSRLQTAVAFRMYQTISGIPEKKQKYVPQDGTYPKGFKVGGIHTGVKKDGKSLDLALVTSDLPCSAAAVFTKNVFKAAPVVVSKQTLDARGGKGIRGLVANSGCANAVTGTKGMEDARAMGAAVDQVLGETDPSTIVMSTGVIGQL